MSALIRTHDLHRLCKGAALAVAAGLLTGAAMQPDLDDDKVEGPQILLAGGGERAEPAAYDPGVAAYGPELPDHVVGTDYVRPTAAETLLAHEEPLEPMEVAAIDAAYEAPVIVYEAAEEAETVAAARPWRDAPRPPPLYPSEQGNTYYASDLPEPPTPPEEEAWPPAPA